MATTREPDTSASTSEVGDPLGIPPGAPRSRQMVLAIGLVGLGVGLLINGVAGPLLADSIDYPFSESMRNQTIGLDTTALLLVLPTCLTVAALAWRGHRLAPVLTLSLGSYVAYMFLQYLVGPEFDFYPATLFLHLALFVGGWALTVHAWAVSRRVFANLSPLSTRHGGAALAMAGFVLLRYVPGLISSLSQEPLPDAAGQDVTMYWLIVLADLGVFVPVAAATAVGVFRRIGWARLALTATVGWFAIVSIAVGAMSLTMLINDDPFASRAQLILFIAMTTLGVAYAVHLYRDLLSAPAAWNREQGSR